MAAHFAHAFLDNTLKRAAPARMKYANRMLPHVSKNDGQAIGGLDSEQQRGRARNQAIAGQGMFRSAVHRVNDVGVSLAQGNQAPRWAAELKRVEKKATIIFHRTARIIASEAQVERVTAINL